MLAFASEGSESEMIDLGLCVKAVQASYVKIR